MSTASVETDFQPWGKSESSPSAWKVENARGWRHVLALYLLAALVAVIYYVGVKGSGRSAFPRWRPQILSMLDGVDVYALHAFPTPPIMGLILAPFCALPVAWGMATWFLLKVALVFWMLAFLRRLLNDAGLERPAWVDAVALGLASRPILGDLLHGNVNLWILFLVVMSFQAFRARRDAVSGLVLALAVSCKVTPALLIVYFTWKRAWSVVVWSLLGLVLWLLLVPGFILGFGDNARLLESWSRQLLVPYVVRGEVDTEQVNQSLPALYYRLVTRSMAIKPDDGRPPISVNLVDWPRDKARALLAGIFVLLLAGLALLFRANERDRRSLALVHELALVLYAMLLVSERSWKHHYVGMLVSYFLLAAISWSAWRQGRQRKAIGLASLIAFSALVLAPTSTDIAKPIWGTDGAKLAQAYGAYIWAAVALMVAHGWSLLSPGQGGEPCRMDVRTP